MCALCVRFGVCVIYISLYKYECVRQQWISSTSTKTTTIAAAAEPLVAEQWMCVQSKWNRDSEWEWENESELWENGCFEAKENISNANNQLYLWAWIVKVIHRWTFLYFARCHLSTSIKIYLADYFRFVLLLFSHFIFGFSLTLDTKPFNWTYRLYIYKYILFKSITIT